MFFPLDSRNTKKVKTKMFINNKRISVNLFEKKDKIKILFFIKERTIIFKKLKH